MLGDDYDEDDIIEVLLKLGDPKLMSEEYRIEKRFVVSPKHYRDYFLSLKMALIIVPIVFFFIGAIIMLQRNMSKDIVFRVFSVILGAVSAGVLGIILAYAVVTFAFHVLGNTIEKERIWTINKLVEIPNEKSYLISKNKVLVKLAILLILGFTGVFLLTFYPTVNFFGLVFTFNKAVIPVYVPLFLVSIAFLIVKTAINFNKEKINYVTSIYDTIYSVYTGIVLIIFILQEQLFTPEFYQIINESAFRITKIVIASLVGVMISANMAIKWYKTAKNY